VGSVGAPPGPYPSGPSNVGTSKKARSAFDNIVQSAGSRTGGTAWGGDDGAADAEERDAPRAPNESGIVTWHPSH
jgi:hypothetical protein